MGDLRNASPRGWTEHRPIDHRSFRLILIAILKYKEIRRMSKGVDLIIMDSDFKNFNIQCGRLFLND